ncbi:hypothetical protein [Streptomyces sp. NPDC056105]|uniref:hypothetical protein n=1 Tax=Streptomyces sp. NPDC056105 TaxID=3345714 RepID=UPI0035D6BC76
MIDRIPLDGMTSNQLDALYAERDALLAELGGRDEETVPVPNWFLIANTALWLITVVCWAIALLA